jgi:hypothetical protein
MATKRIIGLLALFLIGAQSHATTYATWIMVWYGHDQAWWSSSDPCSHDLINGEWKTLAATKGSPTHHKHVRRAYLEVLWGGIMINLQRKSDLMDKSLALEPGADPQVIRSKAHLFGDIMRENGYTMWAEWLPFEADKYPH